MAAYLIARVEITNPQQYQEYLRVSPQIIARHGGKFKARAGTTLTLEGPEETRRIVIIEFPSLEKAQSFYYSKEYQEAKQLRKDAGIGEMIVVEGTVQ